MRASERSTATLNDVKHIQNIGWWLSNYAVANLRLSINTWLYYIIYYKVHIVLWGWYVSYEYLKMVATNFI